MINDGVETSPSHRLERIISGYEKVVYGCCLAEAIGLDKMSKSRQGLTIGCKDLKQILP